MLTLTFLAIIFLSKSSKNRAINYLCPLLLAAVYGIAPGWEVGTVFVERALKGSRGKELVLCNTKRDEVIMLQEQVSSTTFINSYYVCGNFSPRFLASSAMLAAAIAM